MIYNKLVRDRIPEIIITQGEKPIIRILDEIEYRRCLEKKLDEEVAEFHADRSVEELADILEVIFALTEDCGYTKEQLFDICNRKREKRGGFSKRIFLVRKEG